MTVDEAIDVVALVESELAMDPTLPDSLKAAIVERARRVRIRRRTPGFGDAYRRTRMPSSETCDRNKRGQGPRRSQRVMGGGRCHQTVDAAKAQTASCQLRKHQPATPQDI
jgi:hypothetical protein